MFVIDLPYTDLVLDPLYGVFMVGVSMLIIYLRGALGDKLIDNPVANRLDQINNSIQHVENLAEKILTKINERPNNDNH